MTLRVTLIEIGLLIPNIGLKVVNSVVKGDFRAFEVPLSYIGPLYDTCNPKLVEIGVENVFVGTYSHSLYDKKRIRCGPSCSRKRQEKN